jgi:enediyne biosynthesis protein E4
MEPATKPNRAPQIVATLILLALLATPALIRLRTGQGRSISRPGGGAAAHAVDCKQALAHYDFCLEESAKAAGIDYKHEAPHLDPKLNPIMEEIASMGAAVSIVDYDRDGWPDIFVTNSTENGKCHLYHNDHNGHFTDVAEQVGLADLNKAGTGVCMGAVWGDYDNDGYEDVLVYKWGKPMLFHNDGGKGFTDVTAKANLPAWVNANSAIWLDYDRDGKLDLLICGYYPDGVDLWHLKNTRMMPSSFEYALNGGRKYLLHGLGNGTFEDVTAKMGLKSTRWTLAATAADLRGTGYPDIVLANDYGVTELFANQNGQGFREIGKQAGLGAQPKSGMNASVGDILNTGQYAIYVSNIFEEGELTQGNNLWVPKEGTSGNGIQYDNWADTSGVNIGGWSFGAQFGDLNNAGYLDIYLVNGFISLDQKDNYWYDFGKVASGSSAIISDAANWPALRGRSHSGYQQKRVWLNDGGGKFNEVSQLVGATDLYDGRSVVLADLYNTGALDVVVANQKGPLLLYKNTVNPANKWIEFDLEGTRSNRSAIGAEVRLYWNNGMPHEQLQEVSGGAGFCAQNDRRLHFGLGKNATVDKAVIRWPSGETQTLTAPEVDKVVKVKEPGPDTALK